MDFDEALRHMQEGTASDEEKAYVESRLNDADLRTADNGPRVIEDPKPARIKGQKRELGKFYKLLIVVAVIAVALGAIFAGVFGHATVCASAADRTDRAQAGRIAQEFAFNLTQQSVMGLPLVTKLDDLVLRDIDRDLQYNAAKPSASYYVYEVQLVAMGTEIDVLVDSRTLTPKVKDIDRD